jgi:hypothetical protein
MGPCDHLVTIVTRIVRRLRTAWPGQRQYQAADGGLRDDALASQERNSAGSA